MLCMTYFSNAECVRQKGARVLVGRRYTLVDSTVLVRVCVCDGGSGTVRGWQPLMEFVGYLAPNRFPLMMC